MIRSCDEHGYFSGDERKGCPECGAEGEAVLDDERRVRISKFVSGVLRHFPDDAGLALDENGWVDYEEIVRAVTSRYDGVRPEYVDAVVETDPKGRFERDDEGNRIRAAYGHSVDVSLEDESDDETGDVPDTLYHGTARRNAESIEEEGVVPKGRQEVYLSETVKEARQVGARHGKPVVFEVDTSGLDVVERGDGVYAVERVPPENLRRL